MRCAWLQHFAAKLAIKRLVGLEDKDFDAALGEQ
jgi:hypothetical protein